ALLTVLGTLQYRWVGEVSNAERERLRNGMRARAADFTKDFDREITRAYMAFRADPQLLTTDTAGALSDADARARADSSIGGLIQRVYFFEARGPRAMQLMQLDPAARTLTPIEWPKELAAWQHGATNVATLAPDLPPLFLGDAIDAKTPALLVVLP